MIYVGDLEADLHEKCNLKCVQCSHSSPHSNSDDKNYSIEAFNKDLNILSKHLHSRVFRIVGGEPLLNKNLVKFIENIKNVKISDKVSMFTNGLLISKTDPRVFELLDEIRISVYDLEPQKMIAIKNNIDYLKQFKNLNVEYNCLKTFLVFNIVEKNKNQELVKKIFDNCYHKKDSYSIFNGKFYRCFAARKKYNFLSKHKELVKDDFEYLRDNKQDYLNIDKNVTEESLKQFIFNDNPLSACAWCLGCSGKKIKNYQINQSEPEYIGTLEDINFNEGSSYVSNCLLSWHRKKVEELNKDEFYNYDSLKSYKKSHSTTF